MMKISIFLLSITIVLFLGCASEDGSDGKSYVIVTWDSTSDPSIIFVGADPNNHSEGTNPVPLSQGKERTVSVAIASGDATTSTPYTVRYYDNKFGRVLIKNIKYQVHQGTYIMGNTDASWDATETDGSVNPEFQYQFFTVTDNNKGENPQKEYGGLSTSNGKDGKDKIYYLHVDTGVVKIQEVTHE